MTPPRRYWRADSMAVGLRGARSTISLSISTVRARAKVWSSSTGLP